MLRIAGDLDASAAPELRRQLEEAAADSRGLVVLELSRVTFLNCPALRPIVEARMTLGDRLWLEDPSRPVVLLLRIIRLTDSFPVLIGRGKAKSPLSRRRGDTP